MDRPTDARGVGDMSSDLHTDTQVRDSLTALDGWRMEWDLERVPGVIAVYDRSGVLQWHLSGVIDRKRLEREKESFLSEHGPEQLRLF